MSSATCEAVHIEQGCVEVASLEFSSNVNQPPFTTSPFRRKDGIHGQAFYWLSQVQTKTEEGFPEPVDVLFRNETIDSTRSRAVQSNQNVRRRRSSLPSAQSTPTSGVFDQEIEAGSSRLSEPSSLHNLTDSTLDSLFDDVTTFSPSFRQPYDPGLIGIGGDVGTGVQGITQGILSNSWEAAPSPTIDNPERHPIPQEDDLGSRTFGSSPEHVLAIEQNDPADSATPPAATLAEAAEAVALRVLSETAISSSLAILAEPKLRQTMSKLEQVSENDASGVDEQAFLALSLLALREAAADEKAPQSSEVHDQCISMLSRMATQHDWRAMMSNAQTKSLVEHAIRLPAILSKAKILSASRAHTLDLVKDANELVEMAYQLQLDSFSWNIHMSADYEIQTLPNPGPLPEDLVVQFPAWPGAIHRYRSMELATVWNSIRACQLLCTKTVADAVKWLQPLLYDGDPRYKAALYRMQYLVDDIAASVAFHMGQDWQVSLQSPYGGAASGSDSTSSIPTANALPGAYGIVWPLSIAIQVNQIEHVQRRWLMGRLEAIASSSERYGRNYAVEQV